jgi:hypothetical protein
VDSTGSKERVVHDQAGSSCDPASSKVSSGRPFCPCFVRSTAETGIVNVHDSGCAELEIRSARDHVAGRWLHHFECYCSAPLESYRAACVRMFRRYMHARFRSAGRVGARSRRKSSSGSHRGKYLFTQQPVRSMSSAMTRVEWIMEQAATGEAAAASGAKHRRHPIASHRHRRVSDKRMHAPRRPPHPHERPPHPYDYNGMHPDLPRISQADSACRTAL